MPVSTTNSRVIYDALKASGIRLMSALPETWLVHLIRMAEEDAEMTLVRLAKEEEGVGILAGAHLAGVKSATCSTGWVLPRRWGWGSRSRNRIVRSWCSTATARS